MESRERESGQITDSCPEKNNKLHTTVHHRTISGRSDGQYDTHAGYVRGGCVRACERGRCEETFVTEQTFKIQKECLPTIQLEIKYLTYLRV